MRWLAWNRRDAFAGVGHGLWFRMTVLVPQEFKSAAQGRWPEPLTDSEEGPEPERETELGLCRRGVGAPHLHRSGQKIEVPDCTAPTRPQIHLTHE